MIPLPGGIGEEAHYVFNGFKHLLTEAGRQAWRNLQLQLKAQNAQNEAMGRMLLRKVDASGDVRGMLADGPEAFYRRVVRRIREEHLTELNLCPKCGALCRTPLACLCPACNHSWYHTRQEKQTEPPP